METPSPPTAYPLADYPPLGHLLVTSYHLHFILDQIEAGFPSPATDLAIETLDLRDLIEGDASGHTLFFMRASGESMQGAGVQPGDLLIVDRALVPRSGDLVVAAVDGHFTVKEFRQLTRNHVQLIAHHPDYDPIDITEEMELMIFGVVTFVLHPTHHGAKYRLRAR